ncbi:MAG: pyridoxal-phosphate dependent enzyme [Bacteroidales bacterium]
MELAGQYINIQIRNIMSFIPKFEDLESAMRLIAGEVHRTPVLTSKQLDAISGARLFFKCENFQKVGAFKFRGAVNAVLNLTEGQRAAGVVTHSSGNHAAALAHAAAMRGVRAYIVMPASAPEVKRRGRWRVTVLRSPSVSPRWRRVRPPPRR